LEVGLTAMNGDGYKPGPRAGRKRPFQDAIVQIKI